MEYREHWVPRGEHRIYAREYEGKGPAIIPMHGFPDNLRLYDRVATLVLLNTYYSPMPTLRVPEVIQLFSTPVARDAARFVVSRMRERFRWVYRWQVRKFFEDEEATEEFVRVFWKQLEAKQSSFPPLFSLTAHLRTTIRSRAGTTDSLGAFEWPVRIIFGANDPYLNTGVAKSFHALFPGSELFLLPEAGHFPQLDDPEEVARLILSIPLDRAATPGGRAVEMAADQPQNSRQR